MSDEPTSREYGTITTRPVKRFFVAMLTRDIALEDAILDLLDNCVDGILRTLADTAGKDGQKGIKRPSTEADDGRPYDGFKAHITVNKDVFVINDNCGGIPWSEHDKAFRMGRLQDPGHHDPALTVGTYGIGMKRAIFKMGSKAKVETQNGSDSYRIEIDPDWMVAEDLWDLSVDAMARTDKPDGTSITVENLHPGVSEQFSATHFETDLLDKIQSHYAVIIGKGFEVKVNDTAAVPKPMLLRFALEDAQVPIRPFVFKANTGGVDVFLTVGLREPIPDAERVLDEQSSKEFSSEFAGWTVICNDRVVLYCNRDELTGWGTGGVPRYHTQFIAVSGIVEFTGDSALLPTTTTKRGLDFSSSLYQQVLNKMRDGMRLFVDFTNKWKSHAEEARAHVSPVPALTYSAIKGRSAQLSFAPVRVGLEGEQYKPKLPVTVVNSPDARISYFRDKEAIRRLAEVALPEITEMKEKAVPRAVGEYSFDYAYAQLVMAQETDTAD